MVPSEPQVKQFIHAFPVFQNKLGDKLLYYWALIALKSLQ